MALTVTNLGHDENGKPRLHYHSDGHVVLPGPIRGSVTTKDGTVYDVTPDVIEVDPKHAAEVASLIGDRYAEEGHPDHGPDVPFVHDKKKRS